MGEKSWSGGVYLMFGGVFSFFLGLSYIKSLLSWGYAPVVCLLDGLLDALLFSCSCGIGIVCLYTPFHSPSPQIETRTAYHVVSIQHASESSGSPNKNV